MKRIVILAALLAVSGASPSLADVIPYPTPGTQNLGVNSFIATGGPVIAYFAGSSAGFTQVVGLSVNGVDTGIYGLNNHTSTVGDSLNFGTFAAGATLAFLDKILTGNGNTPAGTIWSSDATANSDLLQHAYATAYTATGAPDLDGTPPIPAGTYVGFEDINGGGDFDYNDVQFVFTNVAEVVGGVPEPGTLALLGVGLITLGLARRRNKTRKRIAEM